MEAMRYGFVCQMVVFLSGILLINADIYFHNPSGSNNRLAEPDVGRKNANRLFDSQNNNKGGYNSRGLYYYTGSKLMIEWTNQHSCQHPNNNCELTLQYMCHDLIRDGTNVKTIPTDTKQCKNEDCDHDFQYGMHENYTYYLTCARRQRNKGLFVADQKLRKDTAIYTRQNPTATRRGYECPEERDYYPYWQPSPWIDIAVLTNNASRCSFYQQNSQNVKSRWSCEVPLNVLKQKNIVIPNNKDDCEKFKYDANGKKAVWREYPAHGIAAPVCSEAQFSWDNHLGNGYSGKSNVFNWTVPQTPRKHCVLRIRYNISTTDYDWSVDHTFNPDKKGDPSKVDLSKEYSLKGSKATERGYVFKQNPIVKIFDGLDFDLRLAIDTSQFGRIFQDRSHVFSIKKRPEDLKDVVIHNINVRGKRGNIVQVYPAVEYDFVPNLLNTATGDYIHFQWNGSNTNNKNFEGEGTAGTDRSNVVLLAENKYSEKVNVPYEPLAFGHYGTNYPSNITDSLFLGLSEEDVTKLAHLGNTNGNDALLNKADTYFDLGPRKITQRGIYYYMCTRNNNFSNRDQKGKIVVTDFPITYKMIGSLGGSISIESKASLYVAPNIMNKLQSLQMESWTAGKGHYWLKNKEKQFPIVEEIASDFILLLPEENFTAQNTVKLSLYITDGDSDHIVVFRTGEKSFGVWQKIPTKIENGVAQTYIKRGGIYVALREKHLDVLTNVIIVIIMVSTALIACLVYWYYKKSHPWLYTKNV